MAKPSKDANSLLVPAANYSGYTNGPVALLYE